MKNNSIYVCVEEFIEDEKSTNTFTSYRIRIKKEDLNNALLIIDKFNLFGSRESLVESDNGLKRILVAVDFSAYSINACGAAFDLAKAINAKVKILNVIPYMQYPSHVPFASRLKDLGDETLLDKARKKMLNLCFEIDQKITRGEFPSINYSYSLREGIVDEEVCVFVKEYDPHMLVIGTKGFDESDTGIIGGVAADIIECTNIPVLAVPLNSPLKDFSDINHIAFLTNLDERDYFSFVSLTHILQFKKDIKITLLHVNLNSQKELERQDEFHAMIKILKENYPCHHIDYKLINAENIIEPVLNFVSEEKVQLLSLNTQRRNLFSRVFMPSVSRRILSKSDTVLLVLRGKRLRDNTRL
ncbi:MAG: universal stress protein [Bacteroidales bacterium]|nr:universal stress protein [Bacteroidales bacterium]